MNLEELKLLNPDEERLKEQPLPVNELDQEQINKRVIAFTYKNYKGEITFRRVLPICLEFISTPYHKEEQWILRALDMDKQEERSFAVKDILSRWEPFK